VDEVTIAYGLLPKKIGQDENPRSGFSVLVQFVDDLEARLERSTQAYRVLSGLDSAEPRDTVEAPIPDWSGSGTVYGRGLKRLDLPPSRDPLTPPVSTEIVPEAWSLPDLEALPETIRTLVLHWNGELLSAEQVKTLLRFRGLESLQALEADGDDATLCALAALPALKSLRVRATKLTDRGMEALRPLSKLTRLEIVGAGLLTSEGLRPVGELKSLVALRITFCPGIGDAGVRIVSGLGGLEDLDLFVPGRITDEGLAAVAKLPGLKRLRLEELKEVTVAGWSALARTPTLRDLTIYWCPLGDAGLAELARLKDLEILAVYQGRKEEGPITDEGVLKLQGLTNLRRLFLNGTQVTLEGMKALQARLPGQFAAH
jgi:hypothetical protein